MKKRDPIFIYPKKRPKTIIALYKWHKKLLDSAIHYEFKTKAVKSSIEKLNDEIREYIPYLKKPIVRSNTKFALEHLNRVKREKEGELMVLKETVKMIHDTNELLITNLLSSHRWKKKDLKQLLFEQFPGTNILHGQGWLYELAAQDEVEKEGDLGFITFGTIFDAKGFDLLVFPRTSARKRITWKKQYPVKWKD